MMDSKARVAGIEGEIDGEVVRKIFGKARSFGRGGLVRICEP
jgi:uncharacterized protein (UPF0216 family)